MKKRTMSVGIPAHNEEKNVPLLLASLLKQEGEFTLDAIYIVCDGCTDKTAFVARKIAKKNQHLPIVVIDDGERVGQFKRLEQIYKICTSDILLTLDADTVLADNHVLELITTAFKNKKVGLVGGHNQPVPGKNLLENVINTGAILWYETVKDINQGHTIHTHHSPISAVRTSLVKDLHFPNHVIANDDFLYFKILRKGYQYFHEPRAKSWYREPTTLHDYFTQATRFITAKESIIEYFGPEVRSAYMITTKQKLTGIMRMMIKQPILTPLSILLNILLRQLKASYLEHYHNAHIWTRISSSKDLGIRL